MNKRDHNVLRILYVSPAFYPATYWGGPTFSTKAICDGVAAMEDFELRVLTVDGASPDTRLELCENPARFPAGYEVTYAPRVAVHSVSPQLLVKLLPMARWADVIHLTATYSFPTIPTLSIARALKKPVVWSPRGALQATEEWIDAPRKRVKATFESACRAVRPRRTVLHVTAEVEKEASLRRMPGVEAVVIPNAIPIPDTLPTRTWRPDGRLRLMFLSRIHPVKGLEKLLDAMRRLPEHVSLDVYGTGEVGYVASLQAYVAEKGLEHRVHFHGEVDGEAKEAAFAAADVFVLPTESENFGIVIGEALGRGVPVITTRAAPWEKIEELRCGLWIDGTEHALEKALRDMEVSDLPAIGARGAGWIKRDFSMSATNGAMAALYSKLATTGE